MNAAIILLTLFAATEPVGNRYSQPPVNGSTTQSPSALYDQRSPAPPAPLAYGREESGTYDRGVRHAGYDNSAPPSRRRSQVVPAQFETSSGWPPQPTDGLVGRSGHNTQPNGSTELPSNGQRSSNASLPLSGYTPPNYGRETARPDELSTPPTSDATSRYDRGADGLDFGTNYGRDTTGTSRYRSNDYSNNEMTAQRSTRRQGQLTASNRAPQIQEPSLPSPEPVYDGTANQYTGADYNSTTPVSPRQNALDPPADYGADGTTYAVPPINETTTSRARLNDQPREYDLPTVTNPTLDPGTTQSTAGALGNSLPNIQVPAPRLRGNSYFLTLLALFGSIGLNMYLGWISWDTYNRYQDLVGDIRYTSPRRSSAREPVGESRLAEAAY